MSNKTKRIKKQIKDLPKAIIRGRPVEGAFIRDINKLLRKKSHGT